MPWLAEPKAIGVIAEAAMIGHVPSCDCWEATINLVAVPSQGWNR